MDFDELIRIQNQMASRIAQEAETEKKVKLMDLISSLTTNKKKKLQKEKIIIAALQEGFEENEIIKLIDELINIGYLEENDGFIKINF